MKLHSPDSPARARQHRIATPRSGRAPVLILVLVLLAGLVGFLLQSSGREGASAEQEDPGTRVVRAAAQPPAEPTAGKTDLGTRLPVSGPGAVPEVVTPRTDPDSAAPGEAASRRDPAARAGRGSGAPDLQRLRESVQRLRPGQDDATRLAAAREILADEAAGPLQARALNVLAELDPTALTGELQRLAAGAADDPRKRATLVSAVQSLGRRADVLTAEDLASFFEGGSREVQIAAATALASRGDESLRQRLQEQSVGRLSHEDARVRAAAVRDLAAIPGPSSLELVLPLLADESEGVRLAALGAFRPGRDPAALERIRPLLDDPSERVRQTAARMVESAERRLEREEKMQLRREGPVPRPDGDGRR